MKDKLMALAIKAKMKMQEFKEDVSGSEVTEKIGMVLAAVIVVALFIEWVSGGALTGIFDAILAKATEKIGEIG